MHRHFSNRGEALAEVTAARLLARRTQSAKSASITQDDRGVQPSNGSRNLWKQRLDRREND
jgi:hypothetical protein